MEGGIFEKVLAGGASTAILGALGYLFLQLLDRTGKITRDYQELLKSVREEAESERTRRIECEAESKVKDKEIARLSKILGKKK